MTGHFEISCDFRSTDRSQTCPYGTVNGRFIRRGGSQTLLPPPSMVRDLCRVVERENSAMGVLLALEPPTKGMLSEAASAGRFQLPGAGRNATPRRGGSETLPLARRTYPKVQIFTVEDYFDGLRPDLHAPIGGPRHTSDTLKKAKRIQKDTGQRKLEL